MASSYGDLQNQPIENTETVQKKNPLNNARFTIQIISFITILTYQLRSLLNS